MKKLLKLMNLNRQEWNWVLYDVGNSAFILLVTAIVPIYFEALTNAAGLTDTQYLSYWGYAISIATLIVVFIAIRTGIRLFLQWRVKRAAEKAAVSEQREEKKEGEND